MSPLLRKMPLIAAALAVLLGVGMAQDGVSTGGAARTRYLSGLGVLPAPSDVQVEDFINYHRHEIGRPKAGEAINLDLRWGTAHAAPNGEAILQVGLATKLVHDRDQLRPVNLSLVIDKSGSMASADKLVRVKQALLNLVPKLRPTDTLSIIIFDSEASVLLPAQKLTNPQAVKDLISGLQPGSSTNIHAGLMLGYEEAMKNYRPEITNRVILLTDGIANQGVTEPKEIAGDSLVFNGKGIDLSTIGLGLDLNKELLRELADSGRGLFHFVADAVDIAKVFDSEVQSLISPVAKEPNLEVAFDSSLKLDKVYGYAPKIAGNTVNIKLANLNSGATQVVLMRAKPTAGKKDVYATARLSYFDIALNKRVVKEERIALKISSADYSARLEDDSVEKNYSIAVLAQAISDMAAACQEKHLTTGERALTTAINRTNRLYPHLEDEDIKRTMTMAQKYQEVLRKELDVVQNIVPNGSFAKGNTGFLSGLDYFAPAENCLWPAGYTIAPAWNRPLLHRLFPSVEYGPVKKLRGDEQVFYANAGGLGQLILWSSVVKCEPQTRYRISFYSMSLNDDRADVPNYEIRINGAKSKAQPAGFQDYKEVSMIWDSGSDTSATLNIVRLPMDRNGKLIAICNIEMVPVRE